MNFRFWLAGFVVLALGFPATNCLAHDSAGKPVLGRAEPIGVLFVGTIADELAEELEEYEPGAPAILGAAEPIGHLILVGAVVEETADEPMLTTEFGDLALIEEAPLLGPAVLLASLIPQELEEYADARAISPVPTVHPNEIQQRLQDAAQLMAASGLVDESQQIQQVISKLSREHFERLLLKKKEAELAVLQAEVDRLRQSTGEINANAELRVTVRIADIHDQVEGSVADASRHAESWKKVEDMIKTGKATLACEPSLIVVSKQSAQIDRGGELLNSGVTQAGNSESREFGITVNVAPVIVEGKRIRVQVYAERRMPDSSAPGIIGRNRVQTTLEVTPGETCVIGSCITTSEVPLSSETMIRGTVFAISVDVVPVRPSAFGAECSKDESNSPSLAPDVK